MDISQNLHGIEGVEILLNMERYADLPKEDQPKHEWTDFIFTDDDGDQFELTVFGTPDIKWGETPDILAEIATLRDEMAGLTEANADLRESRRAAELACNTLRVEVGLLAERLVGEQDAHKFTASQLADVNSALREDIAESEGVHDCPQCGEPGVPDDWGYCSSACVKASNGALVDAGCTCVAADDSGFFVRTSTPREACPVHGSDV